VTATPRSTIEQKLLVRSLERAVVQVDTTRLKGKYAVVNVQGLTPDRDFAKEFLLAWLEEHGVHIAANPEKADLELKAFLPAFGVDRSEGLVGTPSFSAPLLGIPIPEIALFKAQQNRGSTELQIYALDARTGEFVEKSDVRVGTAKYDDYTVLFVISFTVTDIDERVDSNGQ
jgi:hypothetical protein